MEIISFNDEQIIHWVSINFNIAANRVNRIMKEALKQAEDERKANMIVEVSDCMKKDLFEMCKQPISLKIQTIKVQKVPRKLTTEEEALKWFFEELEEFGIGQKYGEMDNHDYCRRNYLKDECYCRQNNLDIERINDEIIFTKK